MQRDRVRPDTARPARSLRERGRSFGWCGVLAASVSTVFTQMSALKSFPNGKTSDIRKVSFLIYPNKEQKQASEDLQREQMWK